MHIDNNTFNETRRLLSALQLHLQLLGKEPSVASDLHLGPENKMFLDQVQALRRKLASLHLDHKESCGGCGDCRENNGENCSSLD